MRNNVIHDCGQNGIVGHLGCVFSDIYGNEIYNIAVKHEFYGYEIAGIKFHAAIDTQIHENYIHDCTLAIWLDWETQGTRVSRNLFTRQHPGSYGVKFPMARTLWTTTFSPPPTALKMLPRVVPMCTT